MDIELKGQIKEVLEDGLAYMKVISQNYTILTNAIASSNEASIVKNYNDLKEGLDWIVDAVDNFEKLLDLDYSSILIGKQSSKKIIDDYKIYISDLEMLFNNRDYNKISELIEDKLVKHIKKLISIFNKIKKDIKEKEN